MGDLLQRGQRNFIGRRVGEPDVVELHGHRSRRNLHGVGLLLNERLEVKDLEDALKAHQGAHDLHPGVGQRRERRVEAGQQQRQHNDVAGRELALNGEPAAQPVHEGQGQGRDERQGRDEGELQHRGPHADVADTAGTHGKLTRFLCRAPKELHERGARGGEALRHLGTHGRVVLSGFAPEVRQFRTHPAGGDEEDGQQEHGQHGDQPGRVEHDDEGQDERHDVAHYAGQCPGEGRLGADDVVVQPADERTCPCPGEEGDRHFLHVIEHPGAEVEDDAFPDGRRQPPAHHAERGFCHGHAGDERRKAEHHVSAGRGHDGIHHLAGENRRRNGQEGHGNRDENEGDESAPVRAGKPHDAFQGLLRKRLGTALGPGDVVQRAPGDAIHAHFFCSIMPVMMLRLMTLCLS